MRVPSPLLVQDESCVVVWLRPRPREILDLDHLMRIVNRRTKGVLPPVKLPQKMRDMLMRDKERADEGSWIEKPRGRQPIGALDLFPKG
jgi:hypothetical protein